MATKTDYDEALSDLKSGIDAASAAGCKPIQLQLISRHGARFPTVKDWTTRMGPLLHKLKVLHTARWSSTQCGVAGSPAV